LFPEKEFAALIERIRASIELLSLSKDQIQRGGGDGKGGRWGKHHLIQTSLLYSEELGGHLMPRTKRRRDF
jgi:hypothetical protein